MDELLFYIIDGDYIEHLRRFDSRVSYNKDESKYIRPYIGIVLEINKFSYFVPLYSFKEHYKKYRNNPSIFIIYNKDKKPISILRFSTMIPVLNNSNVIKLLEFDKQDIKYNDLISEEYRYINQNKKEIYKRAMKIYKLVVLNKNSNFFKTISCDFKLLENKSMIYRKEQ